MTDKILILDTGKRANYMVRDGDLKVASAVDTLKILNTEKIEAVLIMPGEIGISRESLVHKIASKNPLISIVLVGDSLPENSIASMIVDLHFPENAKIERIYKELDELIAVKKVLSDCDLVGKSTQMKAIGELILRVSPTDLPVLIVGESGTGKELVARAIHKNSKRASAKFLPVNSAAIPAGTLESELFGHEKGSFTGATSRHSGYFEQADKGTIFLDEIAEIPLPIQSKLLRVLETGDFIRVGGSGSVNVDVRLICATNADLLLAVSKKLFREDLYYRLSSVKIHIPPLRERIEDIPALVYKFVSEISSRYNEKFGGITADAIERMMKYHWPGNIRELKNLVEKSVLLAGKKPIVGNDLEDYFFEHEQIGRNLPTLKTDTFVASSENMAMALAVIYSELKGIKSNIDELANIFRRNEFNSDYILKKKIIDALEKNDFDKKRTAEKLGMSVRTLYRKLKKLGIEKTPRKII